MSQGEGGDLLAEAAVESLKASGAANQRSLADHFRLMGMESQAEQTGQIADALEKAGYP